MLRSMTGFSSVLFSIGDDKFSLDIKSVNHRFVEVNIKAPDRFFLLENKIRDTIKKFCQRGSIYISISSLEGAVNPITPNIPMARAYLDSIKELQKELGLKQEIDISILLKFKDIFSAGRIKQDVEKDWDGIQSGLETALGDLLKMREEEGCFLAKDIGLRLDCMQDIVSKMDTRAPVISELFREKLKRSMLSILGGTLVDEGRLLTEVAIFAERSTVAEELVRLNGHLTQFRSIYKANEQAGRKMDFMCQEILREINTIGSKSNDFELTNLVVSAKAELEKIREQVQNVE